MRRLKKLFNRVTGRDIDKQNAAGETRLFRAVRAGDYREAHRLLEKGANPNIPNNRGLTPLHVAAYWGELRIVNDLLAHSANADTDNGQGWTPLHSAAVSGNAHMRGKIVSRLQEAGAKQDVQDKRGQTAQDYLELWQDDARKLAKLKKILDQQACPNAGTPQACEACRKGTVAPRTPRH